MTMLVQRPALTRHDVQVLMDPSYPASLSRVSTIWCPPASSQAERSGTWRGGTSCAARAVAIDQVDTHLGTVCQARSAGPSLNSASGTIYDMPAGISAMVGLSGTCATDGMNGVDCWCPATDRRVVLVTAIKQRRVPCALSGADDDATTKTVRHWGPALCALD